MRVGILFFQLFSSPFSSSSLPREERINYTANFEALQFDLLLVLFNSQIRVPRLQPTPGRPTDSEWVSELDDVKVNSAEVCFSWQKIFDFNNINNNNDNDDNDTVQAEY